ncbi:MAG: P-loop NTPase [Planctomycetales bacterium]|nr:P-loop NTPase [Planctomycetales bacterium]
MNDQARVLRGLMDRRGEIDSPARDHSARRVNAVVVTGGKGGVGKSVIALNLAIALAQQGQAVGLLDAVPGFGNIGVLCGLSGYWNFHHVLSGSRTVRQICLDGPGGVIVIPGGSTLLEQAASTTHRDVELQLAELEQTLDFLVIDAGTWGTPGVTTMVAAADHVLLITTPEPTAVAATYAVIKHVTGSLAESAAELQVIVNRAESPEQAHETSFRLRKTSRVFLNSQPAAGVWMPEDDIVRHSVNQRVPFVIGAPEAAASQAVADLSRRVEQVAFRSVRSESFFGIFFRTATSAVA